jgi:hypothetical protein
LLELLDISSLQPAEFKKLTQTFSCSNKHLNDYLKKHAYNHCVKNGISKTYFLLSNNLIASYITLTVDIIAISENDNSYHEYKKYCNLSNGFTYPIPAIKIARLATDQNHLNKGYAAILFKFSELKAYITQIHEGCRLITIDSEKDAVNFYSKMGCRKLSIENKKEHTPMLFTLETVKRLAMQKKNELFEFCELFQLQADKKTLNDYFSK